MLFRDPASETSRLFLSRVFSVEEVESVEIDSTKGVGRLHYRPAAKAADALRKLRTALTLPTPARHGRPAISDAVDALYLEGASSVRVTRVGAHLTTWRVTSEGRDRVRLTHPTLRRRKDVAFRLGQELSAIQGVREFKTNALFASATVRFNPRRVDVPHLLRHLECCLPRVVHGTVSPPRRERFFASFSLLGLAFTGEFLFPVLTPFALAGVAIYGFSNVIGAAKSLGRGRITLPVLYTGSLIITLMSGLPFSATFMASMMQLWPQWAFRTLTKSQRRLFATHRQRATWARRVEGDGWEIEVNIDRLKVGDHVIVHEGEIIPVDGIIVDGLAAVDSEPLTGRAGALDKASGDRVYASSYVKAGQITVRVEKVGDDTMAGFIGARLPYGRIDHLPSSSEAEEVANRTVTPVIALATANYLLTGMSTPSRALVRPDYATAPRLSAQLAALYDLSDALRRGILFTDPAALDRLPATDIYVFDDSPALERRRISIGEIITQRGVAPEAVISYAASAFPAFQNDRARALLDHCFQLRAPMLEITGRKREAGVIRYLDAQGQQIEVATPAYVETQGINVPAALAAAFAASTTAWAERGNKRGKRAVAHPEPQLRPLWVVREGKVLGIVTFQRQGDLEGAEIIATLRARNAQARFIHVSRRPQHEAEAIAGRIGISTVFGGLDAVGKAAVLEKLGRRTMWIGDGSKPGSLPCIKAATVSISVAGAPTVPTDAANVILLQNSLRGLVPLRRVGRRHRASLRKGYREIFGAGLFCVAGSLLGGFNTLAVACITNVATGFVYATHRRHLNDLISRMEAKMAKNVVEEDEEERDHEAGTTDEAATDEGNYETEQLEDYSEQDLDGPMPEEHPV